MPNKIQCTYKLLKGNSSYLSWSEAPLKGVTSRCCALHQTQPRLGRPEVATAAASTAIQEEAYKQGVT